MSMHTWLGKMSLRFSGLVHRLRAIPIVGGIVHAAGERLVPRGEVVRARATAGLCEGLSLELDPRVGYEPLQGLSEPEVQAVLAKFAGEGGVFYDLGSNMGYYSLGIARKMGPTGHVYAFEADPAVGDRLERNIAANDFTNISLIRAAVWSKAGTLSFSRSDPRESPSQGMGMVVETGTSGDLLSVAAVCLDDFAESAPLPTLIKSDVEGAEVEVFLGARRVLEQAKPVVVCEMHSAENEEDLETMFRKLGYRSSPIDDIHVLFEPIQR